MNMSSNSKKSNEPAVKVSLVFVKNRGVDRWRSSQWTCPSFDEQRLELLTTMDTSEGQCSSDNGTCLRVTSSSSYRLSLQFDSLSLRVERHSPCSWWFASFLSVGMASRNREKTSTIPSIVFRPPLLILSIELSMHVMWRLTWGNRTSLPPPVESIDQMYLSIETSFTQSRSGRNRSQLRCNYTSHSHAFSLTLICTVQHELYRFLQHTIDCPRHQRFDDHQSNASQIRWWKAKIGVNIRTTRSSISLSLSITHQPNVDVHRLKFIKDTERWIRSRSDRSDVLSFPPILRSRHTRRTPSEQLYCRRWMSFEWWSSEAKSSHIEIQCNPMTISIFDTRRYAVWVRMME